MPASSSGLGLRLLWRLLGFSWNKYVCYMHIYFPWNFHQNILTLTISFIGLNASIWFVLICRLHPVQSELSIGFHISPLRKSSQGRSMKKKSSLICGVNGFGTQFVARVCGPNEGGLFERISNDHKISYTQLNRGIFWIFLLYFNRYCFFCRPSDSTLSEGRWHRTQRPNSWT